ncbi:hypothetical protein FRC11_013366 [Ceratobasidium sp. 423]|nr:hypothetical protein FRC11_013366 [Ceratobasidium sp. 423]
MHSATQVQSSSLSIHSLTPNLSQMYNAIRQTLPHVPPLVHPSSTSHNLSTAMVQVSNPAMNHIGLVTAPGTVSHSSSIPHVTGPHSHPGSITHASSLTLEDRSPCEGSMTRDSPAPIMNAHQASGSNTHTQPIWSLQQQDFHYDQVMFMNAMRKHWHWFLITDNLFPTNTNAALELCIQYAEQYLDTPHIHCDITCNVLDFTSLLEIVEEGYGMNHDTTKKLNELISQSKYIYAEYEIEPIGVCFMPDIIGSVRPSDPMEQPSGTGVSVSMIALACTLVLYTLQSIKAGDTSQRLGTCKGKPLHFTEKKYSGPYRSFVTKLQQYSRLEELRKTYLEEIMAEYLRVHADNDENSDIDIEVDNEMHSDGD